VPPVHLTSPQGRIAALYNPGRVWRVGYRPGSWTWTPWQYADHGRFNGRWDDPHGRYRTLYTGTTLLGCLLEVLAGFRPDRLLAGDLADIDEDAVDAIDYPTTAAGRLPMSWLEHRIASSAVLAGTYCSVTTTDTLAVLRPVFIGRALGYRLPDFDAAALRLAEPRALTQAVSAWLYEHNTAGHPTFDGVHFQSRHGDDLNLIAIYERGTTPSGDTTVSPHIADTRDEDLDPGRTELQQAMDLHRLTWSEG
jgi:hypothetical protein